MRELTAKGFSKAVAMAAVKHSNGCSQTALQFASKTVKRWSAAAAAADAAAIVAEHQLAIAQLVSASLSRGGEGGVLIWLA